MKSTVYQKVRNGGLNYNLTVNYTERETSIIFLLYRLPRSQFSVDAMA